MTNGNTFIKRWKKPFSARCLHVTPSSAAVSSAGKQVLTGPGRAMAGLQGRLGATAVIGASLPRMAATLAAVIVQHPEQLVRSSGSPQKLIVSFWAL